MSTFVIRDVINEDEFAKFLNEEVFDTQSLADRDNALGGTQTGTKDMGNLAANLYGTWHAIGSTVSRRSANPIWKTVNLTGTWSSSTANNQLTGLSGAATTEINPNEFILINGKMKQVLSVPNDNLITTVGVGHETLSGQTISRMRPLTDRLDDIETDITNLETFEQTLYGTNNPIFSGLSTAIFSLDAYSVTEVTGTFIQTSSAKTINLGATTDILDNTGTPVVSITTIQNKHAYVLLDSSENMKIMVIPDADINGGSNTIQALPDLSSIYDTTNKGYYKTVSGTVYRILGHIYVNGSNQMTFFFEFGYRDSYKYANHSSGYLTIRGEINSSTTLRFFSGLTVDVQGKNVMLKTNTDLTQSGTPSASWYYVLINNEGTLSLEAIPGGHITANTIVYMPNPDSTFSANWNGHYSTVTTTNRIIASAFWDGSAWTELYLLKNGYSERNYIYYDATSAQRSASGYYAHLSSSYRYIRGNGITGNTSGDIEFTINKPGVLTVINQARINVSTGTAESLLYLNGARSGAGSTVSSLSAPIRIDNVNNNKIIVSKGDIIKFYFLLNSGTVNSEISNIILKLDGL